MTPQKSRESVLKRTIRRTTTGFVLTALCCLPQSTAHAEAPHYRIELKVPPALAECNREPDFYGMVLPMLAGARLEPPAERVVEVKIAKTAGLYRVDVVTRSLDGRTLDEEHADFPGQLSCFEVLYRAALRAAIQMNKGLPVVEVPVKQAPEPQPPPPVPPTPPQCPPAAPKTNTPRQTKHEHPWRVGLGGSTVLGAAPTTVVGLQLTVGWHWAPSWFVEANVRGTFPTDAVPNGLTPVYTDSLGTIAITPCYRWKSVGGCGLVSWNRLWTRSGQLDNLRADTIQFLGAGVRGFIEHRFTDRWSVRFDADLVLPFMRRSLGDLATPGQWKPLPINGAANAALFVSF
jgi:hypothetical protein